MDNKYEIKMNDGVSIIVVIEGYNAEVLANELNDIEKNMLAIGNVVVQRYSVLRITPYIEIVEEVDVV